MKLVIDIPEDFYDTVKNLEVFITTQRSGKRIINTSINAIKSGTPLPQCKECKYFEYDHVEKVSGVPLIVAHEICERWGDGCKTKEDGYCFMFEKYKEVAGHDKSQ